MVGCLRGYLSGAMCRFACVCVCVCIVAKEDRDTAAGSVEPWTDNLLNLVFLKIGPLYANENTQTCTHANRNRPTYIAALKIGCVRLVGLHQSVGRYPFSAV